MNREQIAKLGKISTNGMTLQQAVIRIRANEILRERIEARKNVILSKLGRGTSSF